MAVQMNRLQQARVYTPRGRKPLILGTPFVPSVAAAANSTGAPITIAAGAVDLSTPLMGFMFILKGRLTVGVAAITALTPEGLLNLLNRIDIFGQHKILQSDTHPFTMDGPIWAGILAMHKRRGFRVTTSKAAGALTLDPAPGTPYGTLIFDGTTATFDFVIELPVYFYPLSVGNSFKPGFMYRSEEWGDSLQIQVTPGGQANTSAQAGSLGTSGATTTVAFTAFQSGAGTPTLDIYGIPVIQGATTGLPSKTVPGLVVRTVTPRTTQVQVTGTDQQIAQLQKRQTSRLYFKSGTATANPTYTALSDTVVSKIGLQVGSDKFPRNKVDWFNWKSSGVETEDYISADPITGYAMMDFLESRSPYSAYAGDNIDAGSTFFVIADTNGAANQILTIVQEQIIRQPEGDLYNF